MRVIRSVTACTTMGLTLYFGSITLQFMSLWMTMFLPRLWRKYIDITMYMWISSTVWLLEWFVGIKSRLFGDKINENDRAIFIMNHRTRLDWLYFYGILMRHGLSLCHEKIVLKDELKWVPGLGWAMQCANYMFLRRNLQYDKCYLTNMLEYFCSMGHKTKILLFPEGTDFSEYSIDQSDKYASKNGLQYYKQVLHPRTAGFVHLVLEAIRCSKANGEQLDSIYDMTVAYSDNNFATNELGFAMGNASSEVHFLCQRYSVSDIYSDENISDELKTEKLTQFIISKWHDKELILECYYHNHDGGDNCRRRFNEPERYLMPFILGQWLSLIFMWANVAFCIVCLCFIPKISVPFLVLSNITFLLLDFLTDGIDNLSMRFLLKDKYLEYIPERPDFNGSEKNVVD